MLSIRFKRLPTRYRVLPPYFHGIVDTFQACPNCRRHRKALFWRFLDLGIGLAEGLNLESALSLISSIRRKKAPLRVPNAHMSSQRSLQALASLIAHGIPRLHCLKAFDHEARWKHSCCSPLRSC